MRGQEDRQRGRKTPPRTEAGRRRQRAAALVQVLSAAVAIGACLTAPALADEPPTTGLYVHVGPGALLFSPSAKVKAEGITIPGATVNIRNEVTGIVELGYQRGSLGVSLAVAARR